MSTRLDMWTVGIEGLHGRLLARFANWVVVWLATSLALASRSLSGTCLVGRSAGTAVAKADDFAVGVVPWQFAKGTRSR